MKAITLISILALGLLMGCSTEPAATEASSTTAASTTPTATQEMAKCDSCGKEVAKATLVSHDAKMMCQECMSAHNH